MASRQEDRIASVVVRPPCLVFIGRAMRSKCLSPARRGLLVRDSPRRHSVDQHLESTLPHPTEEVEVFEAEEPLRIGKDAGVEDPPGQQGCPPTGHIDRDQLVQAPRGRHHVERVRASPDEPSPVGDHRPYRWARLRVTTLRPAHDVGQPRARKGEEPDVVLTQIGPVHGGVGECTRHPGTETAARAEIARQSEKSDRGLQRRVVESSLPVDHHHHTIGRKTFSLDQGAHHFSG